MAKAYRQALLPPSQGGSPGAPPGPAAQAEDLPDLTDRIKQLGLTEEYEAFKSRYLSWRKGNASGARGEITAEQLIKPQHVAANRGFGYWYPDVQEWVWKRSISYWIAVTFFEGAIFFTVSSFMYNHKDSLGEFFDPLTLYGYCAGKVLFFISCYFMCLETINIHGGTEGKQAPFYMWPYRYRTAFNNLEQAGIGRVPYYSSSTYLSGVLFFTVGLLVELFPVLPEAVGAAVLRWSFLVGSTLFTVGGFFECIQNQTFTTLGLGQGWFGALFNFIGGCVFFAGSLTAWTDSRTSCNLYGVGSFIYMISSSLQIIMWKDEQFGLTFLAVLNNLGNPGKLASLSSGTQLGDQDAHHSYFSAWGAFFIHVYCILGAVSMYNFNIELKKHFEAPTWRSAQFAINELLPCLFAHMMMALASAVLRTPKVAPFRQLYTGCRVASIVLTVNSSLTFWEFLSRAISQ